MSRMDFSINLSPLNTTVSRRVISFSDTAAVNFIVKWNVLACAMKQSTSFLVQSQSMKCDIGQYYSIYIIFSKYIGL